MAEEWIRSRWGQHLSLEQVDKLTKGLERLVGHGLHFEAVYLRHLASMLFHCLGKSVTTDTSNRQGRTDS